LWIFAPATFFVMMQSADRYVIRPNPNAPGLWDVWDTLRNEPVFGAQALLQSQARELAANLNRIYREWREQR
jgi:hypothetical protein